LHSREALTPAEGHHEVLILHGSTGEEFLQNPVKFAKKPKR
jgi:hypothetical protein